MTISISTDGAYVLLQLYQDLIVLQGNNGNLVLKFTQSLGFSNVHPGHKSLIMNSARTGVFSG